VGQFGEKFRTAREAKNLSLDDVSNVTKISSRMLSAIEQEHFDQLPGGVFNKGFIRAYAKHLGLNDADLITEYLACLRQAQIDEQARQYEQARVPENRPLAPARPAAKPSASSAPPKPSAVPPKVQPAASPPPSVKEELPDLQLPRAEHVRPPRRDYPDRRGSGIPWQLLAAALAVVLIAVLWRNHARSASSLPATAAAAPATSEVPANSGANSTTANSPAAKSSQPAQSAPVLTANAQAGLAPASPARDSQTLSDSKTSANADPAASAAPNPAKTATTKDSAAPVKTVVVNDDSAAPPPARPATKAIAAKPTLALVIRASENCFISVTADGQPVTQENLIAPAHTSVRAYHEISVRVGNAAAISFLWNGAEIPPQGAEAEVKTFVFDNEGMRVLSSQ